MARFGQLAARPTPVPSWRELIDRAEQRMPGQFVARIVLPYDDRATVQVLFSSRTPR